MPQLRLITWNVLHRIHAINWSEPNIAAFPDERVRNARISETIRDWLTSGAAQVVCLQEVSGDQLSALRSSLGDEIAVLTHRYSRVPHLRGAGDPPLADPTEHLVVLTSRGGARIIAEETFASDPGKGFVAVALEDGLRVASIHASFAKKGTAQLAGLAASVRSWREPTVIAGDFNAERDAVAAALGAGFSVAELSGDRPTRPGQSSSGSHFIDHVCTHGRVTVAAEVLDGHDLSDHNPVAAVVAF